MRAKIASAPGRWRVATMDLTDEQGEVINPILPLPPRRADGRGRPWRDAQAVLNGLLWIVWTGAPWQDLPQRSPSSQTGHRRCQHRGRCGVFERLLQALANDLRVRGALDLSACFIDGISVVAPTGGAGWERPSGARGHRSWPLPTNLGFLAPSMLRLVRRMQSPWLSQ